MKALKDCKLLFVVCLSYDHKDLWAWKEDSWTARPQGVYIESERVFKSRSGCKRNLQRFLELNNITNYDIRGGL